MVPVAEWAAMLVAILAAVIISAGCQDQPANRITDVTPPPIRAQHGLDKERASRFVARNALEKTLRDAGYDVSVKFSAIAGGGGDRHLFISGNSVTLAFARSSVAPDFKRNLWRSVQIYKSPKLSGPPSGGRTVCYHFSNGEQRRFQVFDCHRVRTAKAQGVNSPPEHRAVFPFISICRSRYAAAR